MIWTTNSPSSLTDCIALFFTLQARRHRTIAPKTPSSSHQSASKQMSPSPSSTSSSSYLAQLLISGGRNHSTANDSVKGQSAIDQQKVDDKVSLPSSLSTAIPQYSASHFIAFIAFIASVVFVYLVASDPLVMDPCGLNRSAVTRLLSSVSWTLYWARISAAPSSLRMVHQSA